MKALELVSRKYCLMISRIVDLEFGQVTLHDDRTISETKVVHQTEKSIFQLQHEKICLWKPIMNASIYMHRKIAVVRMPHASSKKLFTHLSYDTYCDIQQPVTPVF